MAQLNWCPRIGHREKLHDAAHQDGLAHCPQKCCPATIKTGSKRSGSPSTSRQDLEQSARHAAETVGQARKASLCPDSCIGPSFWATLGRGAALLEPTAPTPSEPAFGPTHPPSCIACKALRQAYGGERVRTDIVESQSRSHSSSTEGLSVVVVCTWRRKFQLRLSHPHK